MSSRHIQIENAECDPGAPVMLQLLIPPGYVDSYLERGYHSAAGLVHRWWGPGRDTPIRLYRRLGLLGDGSPFTEADESVVVLRWPPGDPLPDGDVDESRMDAVVVPDGAELHRLHRDGRDELIARFDVTDRRWRPAE